MLSGRRSLVRGRVTKPGRVIELDHQQMRSLVQTDAELSGIFCKIEQILHIFYFSLHLEYGELGHFWIDFVIARS